MRRSWWKSMICGKEEERDDKGGESDCAGNLHHALCLVVRGQKFIVEKAVKNVSYENLKLLSLAHWRNRLGLDAER
jgi:hypothetical protein